VDAITAGEAEVVVVATAAAGASRPVLLIPFCVRYGPARLNGVRQSADAQITSATSARELKKRDLPIAENFSMTPVV
jgi:hypothetical protein